MVGVHTGRDESEAALGREAARCVGSKMATVGGAVILSTLLAAPPMAVGVEKAEGGAARFVSSLTERNSSDGSEEKEKE